jgi:hypothetical protein
MWMFLPTLARSRSSGCVSRALTRFLITFCIGAATLTLQSHGDTVREMIANSYPQLGWLAPQALPDAPTHDLQQLRVMSTDLAAARQSVDQLVVQSHRREQQLQAARAALQLTSAPRDAVIA